MSQELGLDGQAGEFSLSDRLAETGCIPVNDDGGEQVKPGHAIVLALAGPIAAFTLATEAERVLQSVVSLALVQAGVGSALYIGIEKPVCNEEGTFGPCGNTDGKKPKPSGRQPRKPCRILESTNSDPAELFSVSRATIYLALNRHYPP